MAVHSANAYHHGPGSKSLLTLFGGKHGLGGIAGYDAKETGDKDPDRLAVVQRMTLAQLLSALYAAAQRGRTRAGALADCAISPGQVDRKQDRCRTATETALD